jgi:baseplate J-like protein
MTQSSATPFATGPTQPLYTYFSKSNTQIRDDMLRTYKNGLITLGISQPNIGPKSDTYLRFTAVGNEIAVVQSNAIIQADATMPDTAGGANLDRWLKIVGLSRRPATGAYGNVTAPSSLAVGSGVLVPNLAQLVDGVGQRFQVQIGGTYVVNAAGNLVVPIIGLDTGKATNHGNGDTLKWVVAPPSCSAAVTVGALGGTDGLSNGFDSEVGLDEPPRQRLFAVFQNPWKGGNASQLVSWAQGSSPIVQAGFAYPAFIGPSTGAVVVTGAPQTSGTLTSSSKSRALPSTLINGTVAPYVQGLAPEHSLLIASASVDQPADLAILLSLPSASTASPPGPGGGWLDGTPWPSSIGGAAPVKVTAVSSSTSFTVNATTPPNVGVSHIAFISPLTWQLYPATVIAVSGTSGAYVLTVDTPMVGIAPGNYIFPQSANQATYFSAVLQAFSTLGPGEWLPSTSQLFGRAFRHPPQAISWPYNLDARFLKQIISVGPEVLDANWIARIDHVSLVAITAPYSPFLPATPVVNASGALTSAAPNVFTPQNIGFYAA